LPARYEDCCARYHRDAVATPAPTAEALMRSRYSAYVQGLTAYLLETWHPVSRPGKLEPSPKGLQWLGLEVRRHAQGDADHAEVEFVARSKLDGRAHRLHEVSRFVRESGRWFYVDGETC
jgi:SEC-C motif domain protein